MGIKTTRDGAVMLGTKQVGTYEKREDGYAYELSLGGHSGSGYAKKRDMMAEIEGLVLAAKETTPEAPAKEPSEDIKKALEHPADPKKLRRADVEADYEAMSLAAGVYGVALPKGKGPAVKKLREAINKKLEKLDPQEEWIRCTVCDEISTADVDRCPFCGDLGELPEEAENQPEATAEPSPEPEPPAEPSEPEEATSEDDGPDPRQVDMFDETEEPEPETNEPEATEEPETEEPEPEPEPETEADEPLTPEILPDEETALMNAREELDKRVERITELKRDIAGRGWDLGQEILAIYRDELWKARGHSSFKAFIDSDLGISKSVAYGLMDAASQFKREDFLAVGSSKLQLISKLPEGERAEALEGAASGDLSYRDLREKAKEANRDSELGGAGGGKRKKSKADPAEDSNELAPEADSDDGEDVAADGGMTLLGRVDEEPVTVKWRSAKTGKILKYHPRIGLLGDADAKSDAYSELEIPEAGVSVRVALKFDAEGWPVGVTYQFVEAK